MNFKSEFLSLLESRGFLNNCSNYEALDNKLYNGSIKAYIGFDPTADCLHVGSLIQILLLKYLQKTGHTPVAVLGTGTALVGDPTGKDKSRQLINAEIINNNAKNFRKILSRFMDSSSPNQLEFIENSDWLLKMNYLEVLRDYGTEFTVNRMLAFESVKIRLERESPLSFLEFNYMILQAIDFYLLHKNHNVELQLGGSDQWGNILNGVELVRRKSQKEVFALVTHLITNSDGSKMGKTANGAIWLNDDKLSSWDFYQYFRNVDDKDVIRFLKLYTEIPLNEIQELAKLEGKELNQVKKILAWHVCALVHGKEAADKNEQTAVNTFEKGHVDDNLPSYFINEDTLNNGIEITQLLLNIGFTSSKGEGKRMINNKGIKINDKVLDVANYQVSKNDLQSKCIKISQGKKKHLLVKIKE